MPDAQDDQVVNVMVEAQADEPDVAAVALLLESLGIEATVTPRLGRYGAGPARWAMAIEVPGPTFYERLATATGLDRPAALARLVTSVYELRSRPDLPNGSLRIEDGGRSITLTDAVSAEGFGEVVSGELAPGSSYFWDDDRWNGL
jgi:hypothetical protein